VSERAGEWVRKLRGDPSNIPLKNLGGCNYADLRTLSLYFSKRASERDASV